ncbi:hypothetical protein HYU19_02665 [Candidatus Woesearchaeota archaeon]|nr:hypothetical protein [Candidatus Woesearchaeota archaeon]
MELIANCNRGGASATLPALPVLLTIFVHEGTQYRKALNITLISRREKRVFRREIHRLGALFGV